MHKNRRNATQALFAALALLGLAGGARPDQPCGTSSNWVDLTTQGLYCKGPYATEAEADAAAIDTAAEALDMICNIEFKDVDCEDCSNPGCDKGCGFAGEWTAVPSTVFRGGEWHACVEFTEGDGYMFCTLCPL